MCLIIRHPPNVNVPDDNLEAVWQKNKDGWGIMFAEAGRVRVIKSLDNNAFLSFYRQVKNLPLGIHFRYRTHGNVDLENCHPYMILNKEHDGRDLYMMHNGTISGREIVKSKSDTWHYVEYVLKPMLRKHPDLLHNPIFRRWVTADVGWSKLLFLDGEGNFSTLNEASGTEAFGCWLSNGTSHHPTSRGTVYHGNGAASGNYHHGHYVGDEGLSESELWEKAYARSQPSVTAVVPPTASTSSNDVCQIGGGAPAAPVNTFSDKPKPVGQTAEPASASCAAATVDLTTGELLRIGVVGGEKTVGTSELKQPKLGFDIPDTTTRINSSMGDAIAEAARKRAFAGLQDDEACMRQDDTPHELMEPTYLEMLIGRVVEIDELDVDILKKLSRIEIEQLCYNEPETVCDILLGELGRIPYATA